MPEEKQIRVNVIFEETIIDGCRAQDQNELKWEAVST